MPPNIVVNHYPTDADGDDVTEISHLDVSKVAGVERPANGTPFLFIKSEADDQSALIDAIKSESAESDDILAVVTGEVTEDEDAGPSRHPDSGQFITDEELEELEGEVEKASGDPDEAARLGERLTLERLRRLHGGASMSTQRGSNTMKSATVTNMPALISKLEKCMADPSLDPSLREQAGAVVTQHRLSALHKSRQTADEQQQATHDAIRRAQEQASTPATLGTGGNPQEQVRRIGSGTGTPSSLGTVSPVGNRGDFAGRLVGLTDGDPIVVHQQLQDEYNTSADPIVKERLGEALTRQRLVMSRAGYTFVKQGNKGDVIPTVTRAVDASDVNAVPDGGNVNAEYLAKRRGDKVPSR